MIEEGTTTREELLLRDQDFPGNYVNMAHPDDYIEVAEFEPHFIMHSRGGEHNRLIARVPWQTRTGTMLPMSFVCDTGAPGPMYLSEEARRTVESKGLLLTDLQGQEYVRIHVDNDNMFRALIEPTPPAHGGANILGLKAWRKLHLHVTDDEFHFKNSFEYL